MPGAFGPPQHVDVRVSAPGHEPLTTRLYLGSDPWLRYLLRDNLESALLDPRVLDVVQARRRNARKNTRAARSRRAAAAPPPRRRRRANPNARAPLSSPAF